MPYFPATAENYDKVIASMKTRFGRDDVGVESYVRELLGLALQNANKAQKITLSSVYDKVEESHMRALETLGVTTDKCAATLYPLIESSLREEVLRTWQRSAKHRTASNNGAAAIADGEDHADLAKDKLAALLEFLQLEVENEERIEMALQGFNTPTEQNKAKKSKTKTEEVTKDIATANAFFVAKENKPIVCIFCKSSHESRDCESARKLSMSERRAVVMKENACFYCLRRGQIAKKCRSKIKCEWFTRRHVLLMCPNVSGKENVHAVDKNETDKCIKESNLASFCETPTVRLQTLRVRLYSDKGEKQRVLIDPGLQRSYVRTDIARDLGYVTSGQKKFHIRYLVSFRLRARYMIYF